MTKRERVMRTLRFEETDRVPLYDLLQNDDVIEHYAGTRPRPGGGDWAQSFAIGRTLDMARGIGGPHEPETIRRDDGLVIRRENWTSWVVERAWHDMSTLVEWVEGDIRRLNDVRYDRSYRERVHRFVRDHLAIFASADPTGRDDPTVLILESLVGLTEMYGRAMNLQWFSYLLADEAELIDEWLEASLQAELRRVAAIADSDLIPIVLTADDIAYKTGPIFSPAWLRRYFFPRLKRLNDAWHERDTVCLFHSDGDLRPVLDDLVAAGIDGLNPLEVLAGMTIAEVRERYPRLFLAGGIDVSQLLSLGTPEQVRETCRQAIVDSGGRGYFLGSTTEIHWGARLENVVAMFETAWASGGGGG
jgi:hypothetical protein